MSLEIKNLSQIIKNNFHEIIIERTFSKGDILQRDNSFRHNIFIVQSGLLRSFYFHNGKEVTSLFALENGLIGPGDTILKNKRSKYNIEAVETSTVQILNYLELDNYIMGDSKKERLIRHIVQLIYIESVERLENLIFYSAKERYEHLISYFPNLNQRVNQGHIASFLGITQETLSRIRGK